MLGWLFQEPWAAFFRACDRLATPEMSKFRFEPSGEQRERLFAAKNYDNGRIRISLVVQNEYGSYRYYIELSSIDPKSKIAVNAPVGLSLVSERVGINLPDSVSLDGGRAIYKDGGTAQITSLVKGLISVLEKNNDEKLSRAIVNK